MKLSSILYAQHLGFHFKLLWKVKSVIKARDTGAEAILAKKGVQIYDPKDILKEEQDEENEKFDIVETIPKPVLFDRSHPDWHDQVCHVYRDNNVLVEGLDQAKIVTNSVEIQQGLPERIQPKCISNNISTRVQDIILSSHLFDAEQQKLPKIKDPLRPAFNFPRVYGVTEKRANKLLIARLLQLVESHNPINVRNTKLIFDDLFFSYPFVKDGDLMQLQLRGDTLVTASEPLTKITSQETEQLPLPNIFPLKYTNCFVQDNVYKLENIYPINKRISKSHPHTLFIHFNKLEVKNVYEEEVTDSQIHGRSLLKTFAVAASYARQQFGEDVQDLPKPLTLQCVQTDGRWFHFGVLQLNTLNLQTSSTLRNIWYHTSLVPLFESCSYLAGKPNLKGYNDDAIKYLFAFYENI